MKKDCSKCYIEIVEKKYSIIFGIICTLLFQIVIMIPILNVLIAKRFFEENHKDKFWEGAWYNITTKKVKVKK